MLKHWQNNAAALFLKRLSIKNSKIHLQLLSKHPKNAKSVGKSVKKNEKIVQIPNHYLLIHKKRGIFA
jgi:hypothetical protein